MLEAHQDHFVEIRKQYALEHEQWLRQAVARSEREMATLEKEIHFLKNHKEGSIVGHDAHEQADTNLQSKALAFKVVPIGDRILSLQEKVLDDACLLRRF